MNTINTRNDDAADDDDDDDDDPVSSIGLVFQI